MVHFTVKHSITTQLWPQKQQVESGWGMNGNRGEADKQRAVVDPDYAAGIEEGFGLIKLMYRINVK